MVSLIQQKKIFIIGGSGSLGNELVSRYVEKNEIICYSRDECKHWQMSMKYKTSNLKFIIGDIRDKARLETVLFRENPDIIIIAAALKHIDRCEYSVNDCILTNLIGPQNVLDIIEKHKSNISKLRTVCFVSTDKACSPVNAYGMTKALSETLVVEKSMYITDIKFVCVRYGNVLNSRGSIIPILHEKGADPNIDSFILTHESMTRFVMTLAQSVDLIEHAILNGKNGEIIIPHLVSMKVKDLIEIFSEIYQKPIKITGIRPGEKMMESLINETQSIRIVKKENYTHILPSYCNYISSSDHIDYNSKINPINKNELRKLLVDLSMI